MAEISRIPICILAGGQSRRFGQDKALAILGDRPLLAHVLDRIERQTQGPVALNTGAPGGFAEFGLPVLHDQKWEGCGPLAGIFTALEWAGAQGFDTIVTVAVDLPFVPLDLVTKLTASGGPAIAATKDRWHPVNGIWQVGQLDLLRAYLESGKRSAHGWAERCGANLVQFAAGQDGLDPFWNVNTPEDLAAAESYLRGA